MGRISPGMYEIMAAISVPDGDQVRRRSALLELWDQAWPDGGALEICTLAHYLADTEGSICDELEWDLRALHAATGARDASRPTTIASVPETFLASLYLNVADCYRRLGDLERARDFAVQANAWAGALSDDPYGKMIISGLQRLEERLSPKFDLRKVNNFQ